MYRSLLEKHPNPVQPQAKAAEAGNAGQSVPSPPTRVIVESLPPSPAPSEEQKAKEDWKDRREWFMVAIELLASCGLAGIIGCVRCLVENDKLINRRPSA